MFPQILVSPPPSRMRLSFAAGLFWTSVACCAIAQLLILRSVRGGRHVPASGSTVPRSREAVELLWAVVPAIGLVVLLTFTWRAVQAINGGTTTGATTSAQHTEVVTP